MKGPTETEQVWSCQHSEILIVIGDLEVVVEEDLPLVVKGTTEDEHELIVTMQVETRAEYLVASRVGAGPMPCQPVIMISTGDHS